MVKKVLLDLIKKAFAGRSKNSIIQNIEELIKDAFAQMDQYCAQKMFDELQKAGGKASMETVKLAVCGTTCTMAIITDDDIVIANVGDSRSILFCRKDLSAEQIENITHEDPLLSASILYSTTDHKPKNPIENQRIVKAGRHVTAGRISCQLSVARAFGDFSFKSKAGLQAHEQAVTAVPDIKVLKRPQDFEFLVLACDGVTDVLANEELLLALRSHRADSNDISQNSKDLVDLCLRRASFDNISCILIYPR